MTYGYIYKISFPNNKIYIGLTTTSIEQRHKEHKSCALGNSTYLIYKALRKHDMIETFELEQIDTADTLEELCEKEKEYIKQSNSHYIEGHGYNMTYGGEGTNGYIYTEDDKKKISEAQKKRFENPEEREKNRQRKLTYFKNNPEALNNLVMRMKTQHMNNPEIAKRHSDFMMNRFKENPEAGRIHGDKMKAYYEENSEAREKSRQAQIQYHIDHPEARESAKERAKQNWANPEQREKMSEIKKKYFKENPEAKEKMSEAQKKRFENPDAIEKSRQAQIQYHIDHPEAREYAKERAKQNWANPDHKYKLLDIKGKNKPFDVFTNDGTFIKTFNYQIDAQEYLQKEYNIDKRIYICTVLSGKRKSTNGFVFKYKEIENI